MLLHNLVDFSMFEIGPMFLLAMLVGSALGIRGTGEGEPRRSGAGWALAGAVVAWLAGAFVVWMPITTAERNAAEADDRVRGDQLPTAETLLDEANRDDWRLNGDYAFRAALITPPERARRHFVDAIAENPEEATYRYRAAQKELMAKSPDKDWVRKNYLTALTLDPNNVRLRLEFADVLASWGEKVEAAQQYRVALRYNDLLNPDEKTRLGAEESKEVESKLDAQR
jgi:hypothetical protein